MCARDGYTVFQGGCETDEACVRIVPSDPLYPRRRLEGWSRSGVALFVRGDATILARGGLAVCGSRRPTPYGVAAAELCGRVSAECGLITWSGAALGCEQAALRAALRAGGTCAIVSACGPDLFYPASSHHLFEETLATGGLVVSMEGVGTPVARHLFPRRNELLAVLADSIVVCEAGERSSTTRTVYAALDMGRAVYAVPGSIFSPKSVGTNRLVRDGACPVVSEQDLKARIALDFGVSCVAADEIPVVMGRVRAFLSATPMEPHELAGAVDVDISTLVRTVEDLIASGIVCRLQDGRLSLTAEAYGSLGA